ARTAFSEPAATTDQEVVRRPSSRGEGHPRLKTSEVVVARPWNLGQGATSPRVGGQNRVVVAAEGVGRDGRVRGGRVRVPDRSIVRARRGIVGGRRGRG